MNPTTAARPVAAAAIAALALVSISAGAEEAQPERNFYVDPVVVAQLDAEPIEATLVAEQVNELDGVVEERTIGDPWTNDDAFERFEWYGEEIYYDIEIWGSAAARAALSIGYPTEIDDWGTVIPLQGLAASSGLFAAVYPMSDTALTYIRPADMLPVWTDKTLDERGSVRQYMVEYRRDEFRGMVTRFRDGVEREYRRYLPYEIHDAFTWIMDLRSQDLSVGNEYVYFIYDGWKLSRLTVSIDRHTDVFAAGQYHAAAEMTFVREVLDSSMALPWADDAMLMPPTYVVTDGPYELGQGWFSLDDRRLPLGVSIEAPAPLGHVRVIMSRYVPPNSDFTPNAELGEPILR